MRSETAMQLLKKVQKTYDSIAVDFDRTRQRVWSDFDLFDEFLPKSARVLDVGCGNGRLLRYLKDKSIDSYLGVDNSKELLICARKQNRGKNIHFRAGDILDLPVKNRQYDAVFSVAVLHHIPSRELQRQALEQLASAVGREGVLFVTVWDLYRWKYLSHFAKALWRSIRTRGDYSRRDLMIPWGKKKPVMRYCYAFTPRELYALFREAGLEILAFNRPRRGNMVIVARPFLRSREREVMGVNFHAVTLEQATEIVGQFLESDEQHQIVTPNPEILLKSHRDKHYRAILNRASLSLPDGTGVLWAARYVEGRSFLNRLVSGSWGLLMTAVRPNTLRQTLPERVTGTDFMEQVCRNGHRFGARIFLLGARPGIAETVRKKWRFDPIVGTYAGSPKPKYEDEIIDQVNASEANVLFVAYGAPAQEKWIARNLHRMPSVKVAVGVGGAFDFFAGVQNRAPKWMQKSGTEWLWRLVQQPTRARRIFNATVVFPFRAIFRRK